MYNYCCIHIVMHWTLQHVQVNLVISKQNRVAELIWTQILNFYLSNAQPIIRVLTDQRRR